MEYTDIKLTEEQKLKQQIKHLQKENEQIRTEVNSLKKGEVKYE